MMSKAQNIPAGKHCRGEDFVCQWLYDQTACELVYWKEDNDCGFPAVRLPPCLAKYPHWGKVTIEVKP